MAQPEEAGTRKLILSALAVLGLGLLLWAVAALLIGDSHPSCSTVRRPTRDP